MRVGPTVTALLTPLALLINIGSGCAPGGVSSSRTEGDEAAAPRPQASTAACGGMSCQRLDDRCLRGECDPASGRCVAVPVPDGTGCEPASRCGAARCIEGRCVADEPPDCEELSDACHRGACDLERGCVLLPRDLAGRSCEHAAALSLREGYASYRLQNECGRPAPELATTTSAEGNAVHYAFDLRHLTRPTPVAMLLSADTAVDALLVQGECDDLSPVARVEPFRWFADAGGGELAELLEPAKYWLVAAPKDEDWSGEVRLDAALVDDEHAPHPSPGTGCDETTVLEPGVSPHVGFGRGSTRWEGDLLRPPDNVFACGELLFIADLCLSLDLTEQAEQQLVTAEFHRATGVLAKLNSDGSCTAIERRSSDRLSALLPRGQYLFVAEAQTAEALAYRIGIESASACDAYENDSCELARELDPSLPTQRLQLQTACGSPIASSGSGGAPLPQLAYRLDLRAAAGPVHVSLTGSGHDWSAVAIERQPSGECSGRASSCTDCILAPRDYLLAIQREPGGRFELTLELTPIEPTGPVQCFPNHVVQCVEDTVPGCERSGLDAPECVGTLEECGLEWEPLSRVCAAAPRCCAELAAASSHAEVDCEALFLAEGARCDDCNPGDGCWFF